MCEKWIKIFKIIHLLKQVLNLHLITILSKIIFLNF